MNLNLAPNELLIQDWRYATEKSSSDKEDHFLAVTNKRVVFGTNYKGGFSHEEILIDSIRGVSSYYEKGMNLGYLALCIIGLALMVAGAIAFWDDRYKLIGFVVLGAILIICGIAAILGSRRVRFGISVYTDITLAIGVEKGFSPFRRVNQRVVKIKVDKNIAREIVETLGSIIVAKKH